MPEVLRGAVRLTGDYAFEGGLAVLPAVSGAYRVIRR